MMHDAYTVDPSKERELYRAKSFYDHLRQIKLPNYYTVEYRKDSESIPWSYIYTFGQLFAADGSLSKKRVMFTRFRDSKGILSRSPTSTLSILEASAMAQEMQHQDALLKKADLVSKPIETTLFEKRTSDLIYNPALTEYSSCVHLTLTLLDFQMSQNHTSAAHH